jgi:hypothetical protein
MTDLSADTEKCLVGVPDTSCRLPGSTLEIEARKPVTGTCIL